MTKQRILTVVVGIWIGSTLVPAPAAAQGYAIEYRVFRGSALARQAASGPGVVIASFGDPVFVWADESAAAEKSEAERASVLKAELAAIYRLGAVEMIRSSRIAWDGKKDWLNEVLVIGDDYLPISLSPRKVEGRRISMGIEIRRYRDLGSATASDRERQDDAVPSGAARAGRDRWESVWGGGDRVASSEMTARIDETVVLGFPLQEASFFISFRVQEPPEDRFWTEMVDRVQRTERSWPSGPAVPPKPRFRLIPAFPEGARDHGVEGLVVLRVTVDAEGRPANIDIVKGVSFSLNRAAVESMRQWEFEPVIERGKAVGATFFISFDFRRAGSDGGASSPAKGNVDR
jgi:TonB family protein